MTNRNRKKKEESGEAASPSRMAHINCRCMEAKALQAIEAESAFPRGQIHDAMTRLEEDLKDMSSLVFDFIEIIEPILCPEDNEPINRLEGETPTTGLCSIASAFISFDSNILAIKSRLESVLKRVAL